MRTITLIITAALLTAAPVAAQTTAAVVGTGRATARVAAGYRIPAFVRATPTTAITQTWQGNGFTEFVVTYTVRGNTRWTLDATTLPAGLTVLDETGAWVAEPTTIGQGTATDGATVLVRVRVTTEAPANWAQALNFEARAL